MAYRTSLPVDNFGDNFWTIEANRLLQTAAQVIGFACADLYIPYISMSYKIAGMFFAFEESVQKALARHQYSVNNQRYRMWPKVFI